MILSAYIHIPFCSHKCDFCDFAAFAGLSHLEDEYCRIVCQEISRRLAGLGTNPVLTSVFYGGGTPGLIKPSNLSKIHDALLGWVSFADHVEITLETTPHAITQDKARSWLSMGINRLSIGIESFQDNELSAIGRDHNCDQAIAGLTTAVEAGFKNVNCDLMYGLPTQNLDSWQRSLKDFYKLAADLEQIKHFSAYGLELGTKSPLLRRFAAGSPAYPSENQFIEMYEALLASSEEAGFVQYEISNFSKAGYQSVHNLNYWNNSEYLAFGVSAHRYLSGYRSSNWRLMSKYMQDPLGCETEEFIDPSTRAREAIMLGLRKTEGVDLSQFEHEYDIRILVRFAEQIRRLQSGGFINLSDGRLSLSSKGVPVSNFVIAEFI